MELTSKQIRNNRIKLLILWLVPFGLMAIAAIVYGLVMQGTLSLGSTNQGDLIQPPKQLGEIALHDEAGELVTDAFAGKWTIVVRSDAACDNDCMEALYLTRQIHIRLDKNANRVQRIYLSTVPQLEQGLVEHIGNEHRYLRALHAEPAALAELDSYLSTLPASAGRQPFVLVDPQGWAMMTYSIEHDGNAILKDLKHLLKFSRES